MTDSGERVSNTWATCPTVGNNTLKGVLIPHDVSGTRVSEMKGGLCICYRRRMGPRSISLLVR